MPINLVADNLVEWASGGQIEEISLEKRQIGWTGSPSDYAYNVWINSIWNEQDKRSNVLARTMNALLQQGIPEYNALYQYKIDSVITHAGKVYRAKKVSAGSPPPSGQVSNDEWELIAGQEWLQEQMDLKSNIDSPAFTGVPTAPTPTSQSINTKQITNIEYVESEILKRIRGKSEIDLTMMSANKAYPILLAKDNLPTHSVISRNTTMGSSTLGSMRLVIKGVGTGLNNQNLSFLEVINLNDNSGATIGKFVKRIQTREENTCIVVWLKGGAKYEINQRNNESKWQLVDSSITLENNWLVQVEEWIDNQVIADGVWNLQKQKDMIIDSTSTSDTGSIETCGTLGWSFVGTPPAGGLVCDGSAVSRSTYSKLFNKFGVKHGAGDGINTFNLPDMRGLVPKGIDLGRGLDSNQLVTKAYEGSNDRNTLDGIGSYQSDAIRNISGWFANVYADLGGGVNGAFTRENMGQAFQSGSGLKIKVYFNASNIVPTADKNQVDNMALLPFVYYI